MKPAFQILGLSATLALGVAAGGQPPSLSPSAVSSNTNELRLNFRGAPLEAVLNYMSEAAGFIIDLRTEIKGQTTVWSNQPVTRDEAFALLSSALEQNGYAAIRHDRTLTIYTKEEAKKRDLPVKTGNKPQDIPKTEEMVTQIIPVRFISAVQVAKDLQPLLPDRATMTANEGGNALLITDTQLSIHRLAEILNALDTAVASFSRVRVFPLKFADAKALASVVKDLFQPQDTARSGGQNQTAGNIVNTFQNAGPGGGGLGGGAAPGGVPSAGNRSGSAAAAGGRAPVPKVVAVAEEHSNSLVVSAPEDQMPVIERLVEEVDVNVQDVTELRVFRLHNADAEETADLLTSLFADNNSTSGQNNRGTMQFGTSLGNTGTGNASSGASARYQKQSQVVAVADLRTSSVVVSAARQLMPQIGKMIAELDSSNARKQQVYVFDTQNTDPQAVQDILQSLFPAPTTGSASNSRQSSRQQNGVGNQLNNRATQNQNQRGGQGTSGSGGTGGGFGQSSGSTGFGSTGR